MPLLFAMMFASQLATTIFLPGLPGIASDLQTSLSAAQMMLPAYLGAFAIAQLVVGPMSDAFGRRRVIIGGLGLFSLASLAAGLAPDIELLLTARALQASGACATMVVARAIIRDTAQGAAAARAMSALAIAMAVGPSAAPLIGGQLVSWFDWRATFYFTSLISVVTAFGVLRYLEETLPLNQRRPARFGEQIVTYLRLFGNPVFVGYSLTVAFASGAMQAFLAASPIILIVQMDMSPAIYGLCVMLMPLIYMVGSFLAGRLTLWVPIDNIVLIGGFASAGGGLLQLAFGLGLGAGDITPLHVLGAFAISNLGTGLVLACCYAQALNTVSPSYAGAASALSGFIHMGWAFLITFTVASVAHETTLPFGIAQMMTTALSLMTALLLVFVFKRRGQTGA
ncbi:MAG: multidrug effflux MFS transporter [Rhodospirillaceae bacterium]|jgi:DHA1 family bicyclomycin/chloramphenicol resistance-like MFS transporter|nr:multidrug effflux MFS transporter [Rhodospirillaceae bacterium]MBT3810020.1 multidrug effflux MFS transporter [Rhodospirillaceae bacterium]MBT4773442.1 multidrug effflux MFS transporter [Rhodospirillaceae bacterium]MBT5359942.1 multidrug effflux MFS transporter [Rhodospirillaceae bacterium]MBT5769415.1 multidrug effflux MFS transporter [Rhodospirillaceae bacterium]